MLKFTCWVHGDAICKAFEVDVPSDSDPTVGILWECIEGLRPSLLQDLEFLPQLYHLYLPKSKLDDSCFDTLSYWSPSKDSLLADTTRLSELTLENLLIVIAPAPTRIRLPTAATRKRRSPEDDVDPVANAKRSKILDIRPSAFTVSVFNDLQRDPDTRLMNRRHVAGVDYGENPPPDDSLPPVGLVYEGFGQFLDAYDDQLEGGWAGASPRELKMRNLVEKFADTNAQCFSSEYERRRRCLPLLSEIFQAGSSIPLPPLLSSAVPGGSGGYQADGLIVGELGLPCCLMNVKNELAEFSSMPDAEFMSYYAHLVKSVAENNPEVVKGSKLPLLGITIIGPEVRFYAVAYVGTGYYYEPLTSGMSCHTGTDARDSRGRPALYAAFSAASKLVHRIFQEARMAQTNLPSPLDSHVFPNITELPSFVDPRSPESSQSTLRFKIANFYHKSPYSYLCRAISADGEPLLIKFTRSYSTDLHSLCTSLGHAPKLRAYAKLPGKYIAVAMDYLEEGQLLTTDTPPDRRDTLATQLVDLVKTLHGMGYVHGDLRLPNLKYVAEKVFLLDYDWGGRVDEAAYPNLPLNPELTDGRISRGSLIRKEDDVRVLNKTLERLHANVSPLA